MAGKRDKNREQDLSSYLRSQGVSDTRGRSAAIESEIDRGKSNVRPGGGVVKPQRQRWIAPFVLFQAVLLVVVVLYLRGPVERMRASVADYSGVGEARMASTSFIAYGFAIEMPPFSLDKPYTATYPLGEVPWTDKSVAICIETDEPIAQDRAFQDGQLELSVLDGENNLLSASERIERWTFGGGGMAVYYADAFNLDASTAMQATSLKVELNYTPGREYAGEGTARLKVLSGGSY